MIQDVIKLKKNSAVAAAALFQKANHLRIFANAINLHVTGPLTVAVVNHALLYVYIQVFKVLINSVNTILLHFCSHTTMWCRSVCRAH